jgi:hypothetical protein
MSTTTPNYGFYLPAQGDGEANGYIWDAFINGNFSAIDILIDGLADEQASQAGSLAALAGLIPDVSDLGSLTGTHTSEIAGLRADVDGHTSDIAGLNLAVSSWTLDLGSTAAIVAGHTLTLAALAISQASQDGMISGLQVELDALEVDYTVRVGNLESSQVTQTSRLDGVDAALVVLDGDVLALEGTTAGHTGLLGGLALSQAAQDALISGLNDDVDGLTPRVGALEGSQVTQNSRLDGMDLSLADHEVRIVGLETAILGPRKTAQATTDTLSADAYETLSITLAKTSEIFAIQTSTPAEVRIYNTAAARALDLTRLPRATPPSGAGLFSQNTTSAGALRVSQSPVPIFVNDDSVVSDVAYLTVWNRDTVPRSITTYITHLPQE